MYQVFRLLSILFMGLTSATFFLSLWAITLFLEHGRPIFSILIPIIFSLSTPIKALLKAFILFSVAKLSLAFSFSCSASLAFFSALYLSNSAFNLSFSAFSFFSSAS